MNSNVLRTGSGWLCSISMPCTANQYPDGTKVRLFYSISWGGHKPMHVSRKDCWAPK